jgi:hypothetical protein
MESSKIVSDQNDPCDREPIEVKINVGQSTHLEAFLNVGMERLGRNAELEDIVLAIREARREGITRFAIRKIRSGQ